MNISVLISVYGKDNPFYLREALKSIWDDQTLKPFEIVLVKDGPLTEDLSSEINTFKDRVGTICKVTTLPHNTGLAKALNTGILACTGDLIARMDSDDISAPDRFKIQHDYYCSNPEADVLGGAIQEFDNENPALFRRYYPENTEKAKAFIAKGSPLAHPAVMFNRRVFDQGFFYNEKYKTSQDIDLWFRLLATGHNISNVSEVILFFRINADFAARRSRKKGFNEFKIYWEGIIRMHGITWKLIFPAMRLAFRLAPASIVKKFYFGRLRRNLNSG